MKIYGRKSGSSHDEPGSVYARAQTAGWLLKALPQKGMVNGFFECLQWVAGDLRRILQAVMKEAEKTTRQSGIVRARQAVKEALAKSRHRHANELDSLLDYPCLEGIIHNAVVHACGMVQKLCEKRAGPYTAALKRLEQTFGLHNDCQALCEFAFIHQNFSAIGQYFGYNIGNYENRRLLAHMLDLPVSRLQRCLDELVRFGLIKAYNKDGLRLEDCLLSFWETSNSDTSALFSRPLSGETLPLEAFHIAPEDISLAKQLLEQEGAAPVHILLYGPPGTGKTTFARSLAHACNVKAWAAASRDEDDDSDRRASLAACLHTAAQHEKAFVLVDEAERLLDTDLAFGRQTKDKAWLNDFLEQPGRRVIWIANQVEHIDPAVRRRFSFSICFEKLTLRERADIWRQIITQHQIMKWLDEAQIQALAKKYPVEAAVINNAVAKAKEMYQETTEFHNAVEVMLRSHVALQHDGIQERIKPHAVEDFTLEGVCLEGSAASLIVKCRRVDAAMRETKALRPGSGTMLFYGPPGTGKTALARYIAQELDRECMVKRGSDIFGCFVGETEQNIARAFRQAEREGAVLVIDEADTFLYSRDIAQRSWETSFVNEFLTALEECRCFCICTTNRRDKLDSAAMRRFSHKVAFTYAKAEHVRALYARLLATLCAEPLPPLLEKKLLGLTLLTPGDFHAARSQYDSLFVDAADVDHETLINALNKEQTLKTEQTARRIGFRG